MDTYTLKGKIRSELRKASRFIRKPMTNPPYSAAIRNRIEELADDVRYASLALAIERLKTEGIEGSFAELGVYQGQTSRFLHGLAPDRRLYLFDTFAGFPKEDAQAGDDGRFRDTSQEAVARFIGDLQNVIFRVGFFPATAAGLEDEQFALVMLDCDLYQSALAGLRFFYPRLVPGGYFFMHDYNSTESDHGIMRAVSEFLTDKPELVFEIPDQWGSAAFRKIDVRKIGV
jgi:O-methyltransferase